MSRLQPAREFRSSARPVAAVQSVAAGREPTINPLADAYLASLYGPDWAQVLDYANQAHAEHDDDGSVFFACVGDVPFDAAPDLTDFNARSVIGMTGGGL